MFSIVPTANQTQARVGPGTPWWGLGDATGQGGNIMRLAEAGQPHRITNK